MWMVGGAGGGKDALDVLVLAEDEPEEVENTAESLDIRLEGHFAPGDPKFNLAVSVCGDRGGCTVDSKTVEDESPLASGATFEIFEE